MKIKVWICVVCFVLSLGCVGTLFLLKEKQNSLKQQKEQDMIQAKEREEKIQEEIISIAGEVEEIEAVIYETELQVELQIEFQEERRRKIAESQSRIKEMLEVNKDLYDLSIGEIPVNYDVENFREAEKKNAQVSQLTGTIFGKYMESLLKDDELSNVASAEALRLSLYEQMNGFLEDSYRELCAAKVKFDGCYLYCSDLIEVKGNGRLQEEKLLQNAGTISNGLEEEKAQLLYALKKYAFDLAKVYTVYANTLSEHETAFLLRMKEQVNQIEELVDKYNPEGISYGYNDAEKVTRYKEIITCYAAKVEELGNRNADNGTQKGAKIVDYGRGVNQGFFNKNKVILMYGNVSDSNSWEPKKYFYDEEGNPIYIKIGIIEMFIMDGEVVETKPTGVEIYQTKAWQTERINEAIEIREKYMQQIGM